MGLNWKKPHTIHGSGPGNDIVVQDGILYARDGTILPQTIRGLEAAGIQVSSELRNHLVTEAAKRREEEIATRVREMIKAQEEKLRQKLESESEGLVNDNGEMDIEGLDELIAQAAEETAPEEAPPKPKPSRVKSSPAPPAKTKAKSK